jgi:hypothetical protein
MITERGIQAIKTVPFAKKPLTILFLKKEAVSVQLPILEKSLTLYREHNFVFGIFKKNDIQKIIYSIIPRYITGKKLYNYAKRLLRLT